MSRPRWGSFALALAVLVSAGVWWLLRGDGEMGAGSASPRRDDVSVLERAEKAPAERPRIVTEPFVPDTPGPEVAEEEVASFVMRILVPDGTPAVGARVEVSSAASAWPFMGRYDVEAVPGGEVVRECTADARGEVDVGALGPGCWAVVARHEALIGIGHALIPEPLSEEEAQLRSTRAGGFVPSVILQVPRIITVHARAVDGRGVPHVPVTILPPEQGGGGAEHLHRTFRQQVQAENCTHGHLGPRPFPGDPQDVP